MAGATYRATVDGLQMAYREVGSGDPIVLLHGNPTSSHLWRGQLERLGAAGRCVAPDLIGMGASDKLPSSGPGRYRFVEHRRFLDGLLEALGIVERVVLVGHDWGGVLAVDWARRHPSSVRGIAYFETLAAPVSSTDANAPDPQLFGPLRAPTGERLVLDENVFIEAVLAAATLRPLSPADMDEYRRPYVDPGEARRPMLTWAREIPIDGTPADVHDVVLANATWMATAAVPKLLVSADPGALLTGPLLQRCRSWPNQVEVTVPAGHFVPEDAPDDLADALSGWLADLA